MKRFILAIVLCAGCTSTTKIESTNIVEGVDRICDRHDVYVDADKDYDDPLSPKYGHRDSDKRDTQLLRQVVHTAADPKK